MSNRRVSPAEPAPHSWDIEHWPASIYPHTSTRGRYIVRAHRSELLNAGALTRIGRELVVLGAGYSRWLQSRAENVAGFEIAPNQAQDAA